MRIQHFPLDPVEVEEVTRLRLGLWMMGKALVPLGVRTFQLKHLTRVLR